MLGETGMPFWTQSVTTALSPGFQLSTVNGATSIQLASGQKVDVGQRCAGQTATFQAQAALCVAAVPPGNLLRVTAATPGRPRLLGTA